MRSWSADDLSFLRRAKEVQHGFSTDQRQCWWPDTLGSLGLGVIWNIMQGSRFEVYWGIPLNHISTQGGNLQDHGLHLQLVVEAL